MFVKQDGGKEAVGNESELKSGFRVEHTYKAGKCSLQSQEAPLRRLAQKRKR